MKSKGKEEENLTRDEKMAVDIYEASRSKKIKLQDDDTSDSEDEQDQEDTTDKNEGGEEEEGPDRRSITYQMAKNKGLTPKRSKEQRNPRVKHRKKFEKAKVRRKGQVREIRTQLKPYGGEMSGINARVKKGIKLS